MFGAENSFSIIDMSLLFGSTIGYWINSGEKKSKIKIVFFCLAAMTYLSANAYPDIVDILFDCLSMLVGIGIISLIFFLDKIDKRRAARKAAGKNDSEG